MPDAGPTIPGPCDSNAWKGRGSCRLVPGAPRLVFGRRRALAKAICASCSVRGDCLVDAMAAEEGSEYRYGVRGGLAAHERHELADRVTGSPAALRRFWREIADSVTVA